MNAAAAPKRGDRVLVSTLPLWGGGVRTMTQFVLDRLLEEGFEPVVGYYQPYSIDPSLSVPAFDLGRRRVRKKVTQEEFGIEVHEIGAWLPELEFMHYQPTRLWRELVASCRLHLAVSGNCFAALPYARLDVPFLGWVATPWREDRRQREAAFPPLRRIFDALFVRPVAARVERTVLRSGTLLALSEYTRQGLDRIAQGTVVHGVLPNPIDRSVFHPESSRVVPGRIGFTGRLSDPRKNVDLFLETVAVCRRRGLPVKGILVGGELLPQSSATLERLALGDAIEVQPHLPRSSLPALLQTLDVYVVPSKQEGLCIAALEAMACGAPVVSTRCGGPEEFVTDGETGYLTGFEPYQLAEAVERIFRNRALRDKLSHGAQRLIEKRYSLKFSTDIFWQAFSKAFGATPVSSLAHDAHAARHR